MSYAFPSPEATPDTQGFWDDIAAGRLTIGRCTDTGRPFYPPRELSPYTLGSTTREPSAGAGTVYSWTFMPKAPHGALALAYVTLDEGPTILTALVECDPATLAIGQRVELVLTPTEGALPAITFTPAKAAA